MQIWPFKTAQIEHTNILSSLHLKDKLSPYDVCSQLILLKSKSQELWIGDQNGIYANQRSIVNSLLQENIRVSVKL